MTKKEPEPITIHELAVCKFLYKGAGRGRPQQEASRANTRTSQAAGCGKPKDQPHPRHRRHTPHRQFAERVSTPPRATLAGPGLWGCILNTIIILRYRENQKKQTGLHILDKAKAKPFSQGNCRCSPKPRHSQITSNKTKQLGNELGDHLIQTQIETIIKQ